jgi:hypothetical protein
MASLQPSAPTWRNSKSAMILLSGSFNAPAVMSALYRIPSDLVIPIGVEVRLKSVWQGRRSRAPQMLLCVLMSLYEIKQIQLAGLMRGLRQPPAK